MEQTDIRQIPGGFLMKTIRIGDVQNSLVRLIPWEVGQEAITAERRWEAQDGMCALCDRPIPLEPENKLLQMSQDRTDSANLTYDWQNMRLTHLACNLGKSDATVDEWLGYLALIRQA